jgi:stress response protein SCP2
MTDQGGFRGSAKAGIVLESGEVIMGLRWDVQEHLLQVPDAHPDLDAFCVLFDARSQPVEIVHPGRPGNTNGSVVHTGDSRTGAREWDDERIFVFLEPLPPDVAAVAFVVISANGRVFGDVAGASCHVSDGVTEREYLRLDLPRYGVATAMCIATLWRAQEEWLIRDRAQSAELAVSAESLALAANEKRRERERRA